MDRERKSEASKILRLGALAAPFLLVACHSTNTEQKTPQIPPTTIAQNLTGAYHTPADTVVLPTTTPLSTPTQEVAVSHPKQRQIQKGQYGQIEIREITSDLILHVYTLYPQMTIDQLLGQSPQQDATAFNVVIRDIPHPAIDQIFSKVRLAGQKEAQNPNDPEIINLIMESAKILNNTCSPGKQAGTGYMKGLASYVYLKDPQNWDRYEPVFLGNCYWGDS